MQADLVGENLIISAKKNEKGNSNFIPIKERQSSPFQLRGEKDGDYLDSDKKRRKFPSVSSETRRPYVPDIEPLSFTRTSLPEMPKFSNFDDTPRKSKTGQSKISNLTTTVCRFFTRE